MKGVEIKKIEPVKPGDPRGNTYQVFQGLSGLQVSAYTRKAGVSFAGHFHKGDDPSKNPELFFLISGKTELYAKNGKTGEEITVRLEEGDMLTIEPGIWHEMKALTDVSFVEYRSTVFDPEKPDTYGKEEYEEYFKS